MLVKEMIEAISNKELKVNELAVKYGYSNRTIQTKIKQLGFEWDSVKGEYTFTRNDKSVYDLAVDEVFKKRNRNSVKKDVQNEVKKAGEQVASTLQSFNEISPEINDNNVVKSKVRKTNKRSAKKVTNKANDNIDLILSGKKVKRVHKGFYLDHDVLEIIENVDSGVRSDLVNECLRKVFKEKGLL